MFAGRSNEGDVTEGKHTIQPQGKNEVLAANYAQSSLSLNQNDILPLRSYVVKTLL